MTALIAGVLTVTSSVSASVTMPPQVTDVSANLSWQDPTQAEVMFMQVGFDPNIGWVDYGDVTYTATCSAPGGATRSASGDLSPLMVDGLSRGREYRCTVVASNGIGSGPPSDPSWPFTTPNVPDKPFLSDANPSGRRPGTVELWASADPRGSVITGYRITCTAPGSTSVTQTFSESYVNPYVVTGLSTRTTSSCVAVATSDIGDGLPSDPYEVQPVSYVSVIGSAGQQVRLSVWAPAVFDEARKVTPIPEGLPSTMQLPEGLFDVAVYQDPSDPSAGSANMNVQDLGSSPPDYTGFVVYRSGTWTSLPVYSPLSGEPVPAGGYVASTGTGNISVNITDGGVFDAARQVNGVVSFVGGPTTGSSTPPPGLPVPPKVTNVSVMPDYQVPLRIEVNYDQVGSFDPNNWVDYGEVTYTATCSAPGGSTKEASVLYGGPIPVTGLSKGSTYSCTVTASNASGTGPESDPSPTFTTPDVPVANPWSFTTATRLSPTTAEVMPSSYVNDSMWPITKYQITCTGPGVPSVSKTFNTPNFQMGPFIVTGLNSRGTYTCSDVATNAIGDSLPSQPSGEMWPLSSMTVKGLSGADVSLMGGTIDRFTRVSTPFPSGLQVPEGVFDIGVHWDSIYSAGQIAFSLSVWPNSDEFTGFAIHRNGTWAYLRTGESNADGSVQPGAGFGGYVSVTIVDGGAYDADGAVDGAISLIGGPTLGGAPLQPPGPPSNLSASRVIPTQASISFTPPTDDGGSAITGYVAICSSPSTSNDATGASTTSPVLVTDLVQGADYTCRVTASNSVGTGIASNLVSAASPVVATATGAGGTPVSLSVSAGATIESFGPAATVPPGSPAGSVLPQGVFDFTVSGVSPGAAVPISMAYTPQAGVTVTGWAKYIGGTWVVMPANLVDLSIPGRVTIIITDDGDYDADPAPGTIRDPGGPIAEVTVTAPPAVTGVSATPNLTSGAVVAFTPITDLDGDGQPLYGELTYDATCTSSDGGATSTSSTAASPATVNDLTPGKNYTCRVVARNIVGAGPESGASSMFTVPGVPSAPSDLTGSRGPTGLRIGYTASTSDGGSPITGYEATCTSPGLADIVESVSTYGGISVVPGPREAEYTCTVVAINASGRSAPSAPAVILPLPPDNPSTTAVRTGRTSVEVSFPEVTDPIYGTVSYDITCFVPTPGDSGSSVRLLATSSPAAVSGLAPGKQYSCKLDRVNDTGRTGDGVASAMFLTADPPSAPTSVTGTRPAPSTAVISLAAPDDNGGAPVLDYTATCTAPGGADATTTGTSSPLEVTGLTATATYTCTVVARTLAGTGPASAAVVLSSGAPPDAPTINTSSIILDDDRDAPIRFTAPAFDGGRPITSYSVTCTSTNGGATVTRSGPSSPVEVGGLTPGRTYRCRVAATNDAGTGPLSGQSAAVTASTAPGRPTGATATAEGTRGVLVSFTPPAYTGSTPITRYSLRCTSSDGGVTPANVVGATSPVLMTGLTAGKTYTCRVLAQNTAGSSAYSTPSNPFTVLGLPGAPQDVVATAAGTTKATVSFQEPADNGSPAVTQYTVTCTPTAGGTARTATGSTSPITVTALAAGGTYTCTARATNSAGTGPTSTPSAAVTLPLPPAPDQVTVTMAGTTATIAFEPGAANGSDAVTSNVATCTSTTGGVTKSGTANVPATTIRITGFTAGAIYTCTVAARAGSISGVASAPSEEFTVATAPTEPPGSVSVSLDGSGRIAVIRFTPPASGGSDVLDYRLFCGGSTTVAATVTRSPLVLGNLAEGTTSCELKARNIVGLSDGAPVSITPAGLAGAPTDVEVEVAGSRTAAIVTFTPVTIAAGTQPVAWHRVFCTPTAGGTTRTATVVAGPAIVTGLVAGTEYSCTVAAGTATGKLGTSSEPVVVTTG